MVRLSSRWTFFYKRVFPVVWFGFLAVFFSTAFINNPRPDPSGLLLIVAFMLCMTGVGYFVMRRLVLDLVDAVWDDGASLVVKNWRKEERVALSDILSVGYVGFSNPARVTLHLRQSSRFGEEIAFMAPMRLFPFRTPPEVRELMLRVDSARRDSATIPA
jgi:hypothetical protein